MFRSQSPQIGSMFLTWAQSKAWALFMLVAIPSNRVNVSYKKQKSLETP